MKDENSYYNRVIKQGNSLCVRIPKSVAEKLRIGRGTIVHVILTNIDKSTKTLPHELIKAYKIIPELKSFTTNEILEFLKYYTIEKTAGEVINESPQYELFKKAIKSKRNKKKIKDQIAKTKYWKKIKPK